jgi:hypothetical protein
MRARWDWCDWCDSVDAVDAVSMASTVVWVMVDMGTLSPGMGCCGCSVERRAVSHGKSLS